MTGSTMTTTDTTDKSLFAVHQHNGATNYYLDGELHRLGGPAIEDNSGRKAWFLFGKRHREDGPAVICPDGTIEYWLNGNPVSEYEHMFLTEATYG